ncbi:hypothetical protein KV47_02565 [Staphylococcus haemolyticus]|uniref:hypothetical protein n=1 Tax=Staphylococcus haemolyticus TaxID=1283 RepID=UPI000858A785|nr:hypothetical protein [Staphylococcus haemolyticus]OCX38213.1 hypothetical protein KV47_02565 [Staphylococcus haemolyticus]
MAKQRYDSNKDISDKIRKIVINSEKQSKQAVTKAAKLYKANIEANTPVHKRQTHSTHAVEVLKISNFSRDELNPTKTVVLIKVVNVKMLVGISTFQMSVLVPLIAL